MVVPGGLAPTTSCDLGEISRSPKGNESGTGYWWPATLWPICLVCVEGTVQILRCGGALEV